MCSNSAGAGTAGGALVVGAWGAEATRTGTTRYDTLGLVDTQIVTKLLDFIEDADSNKIKDADTCTNICVAKSCTYVCPASCYKLEGNGSVTLSHGIL